MDRRKLIGGTVLSLGISAALITWMYKDEARWKKYCFGEPAVPESYTIERRSIDQVFRDHEGYRLISKDERGVVKEEIFYSSGAPWWNKDISSRPLLPKGSPSQYLSENSRVVLVKDLSDKAVPFANILRYTMKHCRRDLTHVEVHFPKNQGLSAGIDSWIEGKVRKYKPMQEIK